jgi:hypothetical protein
VINQKETELQIVKDKCAKKKGKLQAVRSEMTEKEE